MGLAKRGTRGITVDGVGCRWAVSPDDGYMVLVVERSDAPGQRLEAFFRYHDLCQPSGLIVGQQRSIRPGIVHAVIEVALGRGWKPSTRGLAAFRILDADGLIPLALRDA